MANKWQKFKSHDYMKGLSSGWQKIKSYDSTLNKWLSSGYVRLFGFGGVIVTYGGLIFTDYSQSNKIHNTLEAIKKDVHRFKEINPRLEVIQKDMSQMKSSQVKMEDIQKAVGDGVAAGRAADKSWFLSFFY